MPDRSSSDISFAVPADLTEFAERVRAFVREEVVPYEADGRWSAHGPNDDLRRELNGLAKRAGVFAPHVPEEFGGRGLSHVGRAVVFEAAGYSMLGPVALHCAAPDEGNIHLLDVVASPAQRERFLKPLATGEVRSSFCMTEPPPGAGSDPSQLSTTARRDGDHYVIDGDKWLITGAEGAAFAIVMAKITGGEHEGRATMFLTDMDAPGIHIGRMLDTLDSSFVGGHAVMRFEDLRVHESDILGEVGEGYRYAQVRLAPARLTHCMRSARPCAPRTSPPITRAGAPPSASRSPSTKACRSCSPTTPWTSTWRG